MSRRPLAPVATIHGALVHSRRVRVLAAHFAELIPRGHSVLDVGCGDGLIAAEVRQLRPDLHCEGVDVRLRPFTHVPVTPFDGARLPFADDSWDTVLLCDVLHHTVQPRDLLREAVRVARLGVVIKDHVVRGALARPTLRLMDFIGNAPHGVALPYNYYTEEQWTQTLGACGLVEREVRERLGLYARWADAVFGRRLHFVGAFDIAREDGAG